VENEEARAYYLEEARKSLWSVRELQRQINSFYYERLLENRAKKRGGKKMDIVPLKQIDKMTPQSVIRDPLVLEFLGLDESEKYLEKDLENLLITHFEKFMMELGRGFALVARQKRLTLDGKSYHVDLVFYNYVLRCFVLCDLKAEELTHADLGQMQMYVNYYERELMNPGDNPPIGIVLCTDKGADLVRYTLPLHNKRIFAAKYKLHLPTEQELIAELRRERMAIEEAQIKVYKDVRRVDHIGNSLLRQKEAKRNNMEG
jgi:predicted nuclease of restriction endonuclease-like (RecB) superfamily